METGIPIIYTDMYGFIQVNKIDSEGYITEPVVHVESDVLQADEIASTVPEGFHIPKWNGTAWEEGKPFEDILAEKRNHKMQELSDMCNKDILGYFEATVNGVAYLFSFDYEAQANFTGTLALFSEGLVTEMEWTAYENGKATRIALNKANFFSVISVAFDHKNTKIARLRNEFQPLVERATTSEEIEAIVWR